MKRRLTEENPNWAGNEFWIDATDPDADEIDDIYFRLKEYEDAEEQGLLVRLPCAIGSIVWEVSNIGTNEWEVVDFDIRNEQITLSRWSGQYFEPDISEFGKTIFLTRQEAEKALEMKR